MLFAHDEMLLKMSDTMIRSELNFKKYIQLG